jgi:hypothetical protein
MSSDQVNLGVQQIGLARVQLGPILLLDHGQYWDCVEGVKRAWREIKLEGLSLGCVPSKTLQWKTWAPFGLSSP